MPTGERPSPPPWGWSHGVHDHAADGGTDAHVTLAAGLTDADVGVVGVADLADGGAGVHAAPCAPRRRAGAPERSAPSLAITCAAVPAERTIWPPLAGLDLHVVDQGAEGDVRDRQAVAGLDVGGGAAHDGVAHLQAQGREDVALLAVRVVQQGDEAGAVGIVLDRLDGGGDAVLGALEVDDAVLAASAAALMTDGDLALVVAAGAGGADRWSANFSGVFLVTSSKVRTDMKRRAGEVGLYTRIAMLESLLPVSGSFSANLPLFRRAFRAVSRRKANYSFAMPSKNSMPLESFFRVTIAFLTSRRAALGAALALDLALGAHGVDGLDLHAVEDLLRSRS